MPRLRKLGYWSAASRIAKRWFSSMSLPAKTFKRNQDRINTIKHPCQDIKKILKLGDGMGNGLKGFLTAEREAVGGDDAGLDDGVLLAREGLLEQAHALDGLGPDADEEEAEEAGGDVERGDDAGGEVELHDDDAEHDGQEEAHHEGAHRELLPPRRHGLVRERALHGRRLVLRRGPAVAAARRRLVAVAGIAPPAELARLHHLDAVGAVRGRGVVASSGDHFGRRPCGCGGGWRRKAVRRLAR
jgi:hypothetical protein